MSEKNNSPLLSSLLEIGPVIIFFAVFIWRKGEVMVIGGVEYSSFCLLYTSPSPRDRTRSRMPSSA